MIRFTHLQLADLNLKDAVAIRTLCDGEVYPEGYFNEAWKYHSIVEANLRTANLTAISIMANIFGIYI